MASQIQYWSTTPASNATADADISSSDSQSPASVDDNIRSIMAGVAKYADDADGALTAGGTANALTVTTNQVLISGQLVGGLTLQVKAASTNTSATVTFAPDGLTARGIKRADGSALAIGSITAGMKLLLSYNSGTSEWWALNIRPAGSLFEATMSGSQTISSAAATKIQFDIETFDQLSDYDSVTNYRWTPKSGYVAISFTAVLLSVTDQEVYAVKLYKNGSAVRQISIVASGTSAAAAAHWVVSTNGTDYWELFVASSADTSYTLGGGLVGGFSGYSLAV